MRTLLFLWLSLVSLESSFFGTAAPPASVVPGQCNDDQRALLLDLKNSLVFNTSLSTKLVKWNQSMNSWDGVTCEDGRVTGLDLSNESISGGINSYSSLFSLHHLQRLNLAINFMNFQQFPPQFGNLSNLVYLNLSETYFGRQIPLELSLLRRLVTLGLSSLFVTDLDVDRLRLKNPDLKMLLGNMRELQELYLDGVTISLQGNEWSHALSSSVPKLEVVSMEWCNLSGPINSSLLNLRSLSEINLRRNNLSTTFPEMFANFSNLISLRMSGCGLYGNFPDKIFQAKKLEVLDLSYNDLLHGNLPEFPANGSLETLALTFTNIEGMLPESIVNLQNLSRIELSDCKISGQLPRSIANLSKLVYLDLSSNNLTGSIPALSRSNNLVEIVLSHNHLSGEINSTRWESLRNLENLNLRFNSLSGMIPASLFVIPSIRTIQLASNKFSGQLSLPSKFSSSYGLLLDTLELDGNNLEGPVPETLFGFQELKYLSISSNRRFSGSVHLNSVLQIGGLSHLDLSFSNLTVDASGTMSTFPQLGHLSLASCRLRSFPLFLSNQTGLIHLDLSNNQIHGDIPDWIWQLNNLLYLNLSSNVLDYMDTSARMSHSLATLDLHDNKLGGELPSLPPYAFYLDFSRNNFDSLPVIPRDTFTTTMFFSLSKNHLHGLIPGSLCQAGSLQVLDLSDNYFSGNIPICLMKLMRSYSPMKVLNLRNNNLTGSIPDSFPGKCALKTLDLSMNQLEGKLPNSLSKCTMIEVLDIGQNRLTDAFPCHLKNLSSLRVLVLRSNNFSGPIVCHGSCGTWDKLQIFDLADNDFSGQLPRKCLSTWGAMKVNVDQGHLQFPFMELSGLYYQDTVTVTVKGLSVELEKILIAFTSIDFSNNRLEGLIPDELGDLRALYYLNLSHNNAIMGPIPSSLQNLRQLESLDLSGNHLTGTIPPQLTDLNFLSLLNLSHNQLVGRIPEGKQFFTFTESSYEGNTGLCGTPLKKVCSVTKKKPELLSDEDATVVVVHYWHLMIVGYGVGLAVILTLLTLSEKAQKWRDAVAGKIKVLILAVSKSF